MKQIIILLFVFATVGCCNSQESLHSELIDDTYTRLELLGVNTDSTLVFTYYISNQNTSVLNQLKDSLTQNGEYSMITQATQNEGGYGSSMFKLSIEEQRTHSRESLLVKLNELNEMVRNCDINSYTESIMWSVHLPNSKSILPSIDDFKQDLRLLSDSAVYAKAKRLAQFALLDYSIAAFERCVANDYFSDSSLFNIAQYYYGLQKYDLSLNAHRKLYEQNPKSVQMLSSIAWMLKYNKEYKEAIECFEKVIVIDPLNISAINYIALIHFELKEYSAALAYFEKTLEIEASNGLAKNYIGRIKQMDL